MKNTALILLGALLVILFGWIAFTLHDSKGIGRYQHAVKGNGDMIIDSKTGALYIVVESDFDKKIELKTIEFSSAPK